MSGSDELFEMYDPAARDASDTLDGDLVEDPLDQGVAPPDRWSAGEGFGTTAEEQEEGESLDEHLSEEEPEPDPYSDDLPYDTEQDQRSGRLVAEDEGAHPDTEEDLVARDVGIDAGAASAEEAAVHDQEE